MQNYAENLKQNKLRESWSRHQNVTGLGLQLVLALLTSTLNHGTTGLPKMGMARGSYSGGKGARSLVTRALMESICFRLCE
jgi:hypothetical protein